MTDAAWQRLGSVVEQRIKDLGLDYTEVARRARMSIETLAKIRRGERVTAKMLRRLEAGLVWESRSADAVLDGGDPTGLSMPTELYEDAELGRDDELRGALDADQPSERGRPTLRELSQDWSVVQGLTWVEHPEEDGLLYYTVRRRRHGRIWTHSSTLPASVPVAEAWELLVQQQDEHLDFVEEQLRME